MRTPLRYALELNWEGPPGLHYADYGRTYRVRFEGKHDLVGSADPAFRGDPQLPNPEEMFLSSISACHMLTYLALAHGRGLRVAAYRDAPEAELTLEPGGTGTVSCVRLRPSVTIGREEHRETAESLHAAAHERCFVARSIATPVDIRPQVFVDDSASASPPSPDADLRDLSVRLEHRPGALAALGDALGRAGVSLEGGGVWAGDDGHAQAHFLVRQPETALRALAAAGLEASARPVVLHRLAQGVPGQLGQLAHRLAAAGIDIEVQYSDHDHRLVLVVDDPEAAGRVLDG